MTRIYKIEEEVPAFDLARALRIDDYGNQETEQRERRDQESDHNEEERNQENNNEHQEYRDINAEVESHDNNQSSENGNQESEQNERNEDENQKDEDEAEDEEDEKRKVIAKGKRPMSEICKLTFMVPKFSSLQKGETSYKVEEEAKSSPPEEELNQDMYDDDDDQDLAILKSLSHFYYSNGYAPSHSSNELHKHIKDSIPNLKIRGEELINKVFTLEDQFKTVRELDGDNPDMPRPVDREIFKLSMSIWGNSEDNVEHNQGAYDENIQYQALTYFLKDFL